MTCTIVAELSANHQGSLQKAIELVDAAANAGADAIKLQTWTPGRMVLDKTYVLQSGPWKGRNLAKLYDEAFTPWEWHAPLFEHARGRGLTAFSTVFDADALRFLEGIGCPMYKISSFEIVDLELIKAVAQTGKPLIISTGMANKAEISRAVHWAKLYGAGNLTLLKCTSAYPAPPESMNLRTMADMGIAFEYSVDIGLSDHTRGIAVPVAAVALGATMIEKHLCLERNQRPLDAGFSLEPHEFAQMVEACREAEKALGVVDYGVQPEETHQRELRRSLYFVRDIPAGNIVQREDIATARPGTGDYPSHSAFVIGGRAKRDIKAGEPVMCSINVLPPFAP